MSSTATAPNKIDIYSDGTYLAHNSTWHVEDSQWKARQIDKLRFRNKLRFKTLAEVGCGAGDVLYWTSMHDPDMKCFGYEISPQAYAMCLERHSRSYRMQFLQKDILREDVYYDCLLCIDVFEHVEDCFGFLRGLKSKADYKVFHIPLDISVLAVLRGSLMKWRKNVGHVHYFTLDTALALVKDCGYEIIDGFYTNKFADLEPSTWKGYLASFPRKVLLKISPKWLALILGGPSYIVLAR